MSRLTRLGRRCTLTRAFMGLALLGCGAQNSDQPAQPTADEAVQPGVSADPAPDDEATRAMKKAYAALGAAKYEMLPELIAELDAAFEAHPDNARLALYAATMRLWRAIGRDAPIAQQFDDVNPALKLLERGYELSPDEPHIGPFLGVLQMGFGNAANDDKWRAKGRKTLEDSIRLYPPYVNGVLMQGLGAVPRTHPYFADATKVVDDMFAGCGHSEAQRAALDMPYPKGPAPGTCWNGGIVSHVWEGSLLIVGDIFVKAGDADRARRLYDLAKTSPTYKRWPFRTELEQRIAQVEQRMALYLDGDDANDPPTWMEEHKLCVGCHADEP